MGNPLHLKYRPDNFDCFFGNKEVIETLKSIFNRDEEDQPNSFLFVGPSGTGKTTMARIIKNILDVTDKDFVEKNTANTRGIDSIREIIESSKMHSLSGGYKIYLLDEIHMATKEAANALLKFLEDTPIKTKIILCTTEPEKILKAIKTRCTMLNFSLLNSKDSNSLLKHVLNKENIEFSKNIISKIIDLSDGSPREMLKILDQIIDIEDDGVMLKAIESYGSNEAKTIDLCRALMKGESWKEVSKILKSIEDEPEKVRRAILGYFSSVLLNKGDIRTAMIMDEFKNNFYDTGKAGLVLSCYLALSVDNE